VITGFGAEAAAHPDVWIDPCRSVGPPAPLGGFTAGGLRLEALRDHTIRLELSGATRDPFRRG
jgi:hypothetical protein